MLGFTFENCTPAPHCVRKVLANLSAWHPEDLDVRMLGADSMSDYVPLALQNQWR